MFSDWLFPWCVWVNCYWPSPAQSFLAPGPAGLMIVFFCLMTLGVIHLLSWLSLGGSCQISLNSWAMGQRLCLYSLPPKHVLTSHCMALDTSATLLWLQYSCFQALHQSIRGVIETEFHSNNMNSEDGFCLSKPQKSLICFCKITGSLSHKILEMGPVCHVCLSTFPSTGLRLCPFWAPLNPLPFFPSHLPMCCFLLFIFPAACPNPTYITSLLLSLPATHTLMTSHLFSHAWQKWPFWGQEAATFILSPITLLHFSETANGSRLVSLQVPS
jgi:hypothetical protein